jgi:peptide/nickel transport system permease protein
MTAGTAATVKKKSAPVLKSPNQSYWSLVWWKFRRNRIAIIGGIIIMILYMSCVAIPEFLAPYKLEHRTNFPEAPPQRIHLISADGKFQLRPYVYGLIKKTNTTTLLRTYVEDTKRVYPVRFFVKGDPYKLFGLIPMDLHLYGVGDPKDKQATIFLLGSDKSGRDMLSRILFGGRLSLMIGLMGQILTLLLGSILGSLSGYYGGAVDMVIQRGTELLSAFPDIPLFMTLSAAIPQFWSPIAVYFIITIILSFLGWGGLARQLRGMILSLREREYVLAAISAGASDSRIMFRHLLPGTMSHIVVIATLSVPGMILGETALSWLGLGLRPPLTSWGVLLQEAGTVRIIHYVPWELWVVPFIIVTVMAYNMLGDGLRDALDPYSGR